jgi:hypothetical protein
VLWKESYRVDQIVEGLSEYVGGEQVKERLMKVYEEISTYFKRVLSQSDSLIEKCEYDKASQKLTATHSLVRDFET